MSFLLTQIPKKTSGNTSCKQAIFNFVISMKRRISKLEPATVNLPDQSVAYLKRAGSGETIVLLHGFLGDKDHWNDFVRELPSEYNVIAFDLSGHGDNPHLSNITYSIEYMTHSLIRAVDALGLKTFHILGNSMGGAISILFTARNPERVKTMSLYNSVGVAKESLQPSDFQLAIDKGKNPHIVRTREDFLELLSYVFFKKPFIPWPVLSVFADKAIANSAFNNKMTNEINPAAIDIKPALATIKTPTLVVWGDHDRSMHVSCADVFKRELPHAEVIIMKNCGHFPMVERPKEAAADYVAFLNKHKNF